MSSPNTQSMPNSKNSHSTPMVMEKQNATTAQKNGDSENAMRSERFKMDTSAKPMAAARNPLNVCSSVSQNGMRV